MATATPEPDQPFASDYPECTAALLYRGTERLLIDGIQCLPGEEFLRQLHPSRPLLGQLPATPRSPSRSQ